MRNITFFKTTTENGMEEVVVLYSDKVQRLSVFIFPFESESFEHILSQLFKEEEFTDALLKESYLNAPLMMLNYNNRASHTYRREEFSIMVDNFLKK